MAGAAPLPMERHRYQDFSLPSQPRDRSRPLARDPRRRGHRAREPGRRHRLEDVRPAATGSSCPAYIVDELRALVGATGAVENANGLLIDPADGLRIINDVDQLAIVRVGVLP